MLHSENLLSEVKRYYAKIEAQLKSGELIRQEALRANLIREIKEFQNQQSLESLDLTLIDGKENEYRMSVKDHLNSIIDDLELLDSPQSFTTNNQISSLLKEKFNRISIDFKLDNVTADESEEEKLSSGINAASTTPKIQTILWKLKDSGLSGKGKGVTFGEIWKNNNRKSPSSTSKHKYHGMAETSENKPFIRSRL